MDTLSSFILGSHPVWDPLHRLIQTETVFGNVRSTAGDNSSSSGNGNGSVLHASIPSTAIVSLAVLSTTLIGGMVLLRWYTRSPVKLTHHAQVNKRTGERGAMIDVYDPATKKVKQEWLIDYVKRKCPSLRTAGPQSVFWPTLWMANGHLQTAYAAYKTFSRKYQVPYERELLQLPDGGQVSIDWSPSLKKQPKTDVPTLVILHGLTGGSYEAYIRHLVEVLNEKHGYRCIVFNARACANTPLTTPQLYCGSWTDDLRQAVKHIRQQLPDAKLMSIGFSLGSNVLMNFMGEEGEDCEFMGAMSVGNPFDLMGTCVNMERGWMGKHIYSPTMGGNLKRLFFQHAHLFKSVDYIDLDEVAAGKSIRDFDERVTRRVFKYRTVHEYYRMASSCQRILDIRRPFLCLSAEDDPIAIEQCIARDEIKENPFGLLATTSRGGHLGWFEGFWSPTRWCTRPLAEYCCAMFEADVRSLKDSHGKLPCTLANQPRVGGEGQHLLEQGATTVMRRKATVAI
ncbi:hypothetical protein DFQ27_001126 [Actinomortierella ambigua]|uniref:AB hydrolase-1 domain-containing protein n=1 Tax=Actinomortierella ambigua TaxID=1343610 RepID=A0A9P6QD48_9FUNG|nr:hypothetical protein DFQ27_001126 [Actinomortierella ambigua]